MAVLELIGGALLGAGLAEASAWRSRRDERRYQERQRELERGYEQRERELEREYERGERVRERQREAVRDLDGYVEATHSKIAVVGADEVADFAAANTCWQDGWFKAMPYVRSSEIRERYDALGWVILTCWLEQGRGKFVEVGAILRAVENVRRACSAFVLEEPLPPPCFPSRGAASAMVKIEARGESDWTVLLDWMDENPPRPAET